MIINPPDGDPLATPAFPNTVIPSQKIVSDIESTHQSLPPDHQDAIDHAMGIVSAGNLPVKPAPAPPVAPPAVGPVTSPAPQIGSVQPAQSQTEPSALPVMPTRSVVAPSIQTPAQQELSRVHSTGSGVSQIKNPLGRIAGTIGDVIASGIFPRFGQFIPGTSAHHQLIEHGLEKQVSDEAAQQKSLNEESEAESKTGLENAQAEEQRSLPELHKTQAELAAQKLSSANSAKDADRAVKEAAEERKKGDSQQRIAAGLAEHGLKLDPETKEIVALPYAEMTETQKAAHDLKNSQSELASARTDYVKAQKDGIPVAQELARKRMQAAQETASVAAGRLGLSRDEFNAQFLGVAPGGAPLAGGETDEVGHPIGTKLAAAGKPGAAAQGRASQAESIIEAGNNLKAEIDKHKDKMGKIGSYWNQFANGSPIADPDAARLMSEIASYAALQPAMHGMRGGQVMKEFEKMVGGIPKNPEAMKAAIDGIASTASVMAKQGQPQQHHAGATTSNPQVKKYNPATGKLE